MIIHTERRGRWTFEAHDDDTITVIDNLDVACKELESTFEYPPNVFWSDRP